MANVVNNCYSILGEYDPDNLIAGEEMPIINKGVTLAAGQSVLKRGALLGIVTASGLAVLCDNTKTDGSQIPKYILSADTDTGASGSTLNAPAVAYQSGVFNRAAVTTVSGQDIHTFEDQLREYNIIFKDTMPYPTV